MKTTVDKTDETTVELTVEVEPERVKKDIDAAARELAKQVEIKGFRKGKAPRRLIEQRFGKGAIMQQALEPAINDYYAEAMEEADLAPVAPPEIDPESLTFDEDEGCKFTATIAIRPEFEAPEHTGIQLPFPIWDVSDDGIDEELSELRERFAEVDVVERAADTGDYVTIDLEFAVDGEVQEEAGVEDAMYEIGSEGVTPKLDDELVGATAGDVIEYSDTLPEEFPEHGGEEAEFTVTVKDVRSKTLPALDDDFALTASEYDTIDELRDSIREQQERRAVVDAQHTARSRVLESYLALVDVPVPPQMVDAEVDGQLSQIQAQADQFGVEVEDLFEMEGVDREEWEEQTRTNAESQVKARLVLDQLAEDLELEVSDEDVSREIMRHAQQNQVSPQQVAETIQQQGTLGALVGDILRRKAIDAIYDEADLEGAPDDATLIRLGLQADPDAEVPADAMAAVEEAIEQNTVPVDEAGDSADSPDSVESPESDDSEDESSEEE